jgi:hypothetical protein
LSSVVENITSKDREEPWQNNTFEARSEATAKWSSERQTKW